MDLRSFLLKVIKSLDISTEQRIFWGQLYLANIFWEVPCAYSRQKYPLGPGLQLNWQPHAKRWKDKCIWLLLFWILLTLCNRLERKIWRTIQSKLFKQYRYWVLRNATDIVNDERPKTVHLCSASFFARWPSFPKCYNSYLFMTFAHPNAKMKCALK